MHEEEVVVVRRFGFFSALVLGVCGALVVIVLCVTAVVLYGLHLFDSRLDRLADFAPVALKEVSGWLEHMPPALSDAVSDRRAPQYRDQLRVTARLTGPDEYFRHLRCVVETTNEGPETVSLLAVRATLQDEAGRLIGEQTAYLATPLAIEDEWRGPLLPGSTRRVPVDFPRFHHEPRPDEERASVEVEITELRLWNRPPDTPMQDPTPRQDTPQVPDSQASDSLPRILEEGGQQETPAEQESHAETAEATEPAAADSEDDLPAEAPGG